MRRWSMFSIGFLMLCSVASVHAQPGKKVQSPAELFPAGCLGYAELQNHDELAKEIRNLFKGSYLANVPNSLTKLKNLNNIHGEEADFMRILGAALAPEMIRELGRVQGVGVAMIHPTEYAVVVLPGKSNVPGLAMRAFLNGRNVKKVGMVEKVALYQMVVRRKPTRFKEDFPKDEFKEKFKPKETGKEEFGEGNCGEKFAPPAPPQNEDAMTVGPVMAMLPGVLVAGSESTVKDIILRAKGKKEGPSLAENKLLKEVRAKMGVKPGAFAFVDMAELKKLYDQFLQFMPEEEKKRYREILDLANMKAFRGVGYSVSLEKGSLGIRELVLLDPKQKSPMMELYPKKAFNTALLRFAGKNSKFVAGISNDNAEVRCGNVLKIVEKMIPPDFQGHTPADHIKAFENKLNVSVIKDIVGPVTNIEFILGDILKAPIKEVTVKGPNFTKRSRTPMLPMVLVVETRDEKSAMTMMNLLPKIRQFKEFEGAKMQTKKVKGQKVMSLALANDYTLNYARSGNVLLIGPYKEAIADALNIATKKNGLNTNKELMGQLKENGNAFLVAAVKPLVGLGGIGSSESEFRNLTPDQNGKDRKDVPEKGGKVTTKVKIIPNNFANNSPQDKVLMKIMQQTSWLTMTVTRTPEQLTLVGKFPKVNKLVAPMVNLALESAARQGKYRTKGEKTVPKERIENNKIPNFRETSPKEGNVSSPQIKEK